MKILQVVDVPYWAISQLARVITDGNKHLNIQTIYIHPKDLRRQPDVWGDEFEMAVQEYKPDVVHFQYWDLANMLMQYVPQGVKTIVSHHNQKNITDLKVKADAVTGFTQKSCKEIADFGHNAVYIRQGIDVERYKFNENYDINNNTLGYIGRIVPWKGLYEIAKCAKELGTRVMVMGKLDRPEYHAKVMEYADVIDWYLETPEDLKVDVIHKMGIYVGNSVDNLEEGPLGLLEAIACGIPIVTTNAGGAKDIIKDGENGFICDFENYESLKSRIRKMMNLKEERNEMRAKAWNAIKEYDIARMARSYEKLYYKLAYNNDLVSVIIPTYNRPKTIGQVVEAYAKQTYKPLEIIVVDDGSEMEYDEIIKINDTALKYIKQDRNEYGLARARNNGLFEACGHYVIFSDDRYVPNVDAVEKFVEAIKRDKKKCVYFGDKGANKKEFIENFFIIRRKDIVDAGMFNERINEYGGQSQEIRDRLKSQGFVLTYLPEAKAQTLFGTHNRNKRRYEILHMKNKLWKIKN